MKLKPMTRDELREPFREEFPSLPIAAKDYGTTPGGISLDPRVNPGYARMAGRIDRLEATEAELRGRIQKVVRQLSGVPVDELPLDS